MSSVFENGAVAYTKLTSVGVRNLCAAVFLGEQKVTSGMEEECKAWGHEICFLFKFLSGEILERLGVLRLRIICMRAGYGCFLSVRIRGVIIFMGGWEAKFNKIIGINLFFKLILGRFFSECPLLT